MEGYTSQITAYVGDVVCDAVFLNPVRFSKCWYTLMKVRVGNVTVSLKQVLLPSIKMTKIDKINTLRKRNNKKGGYEIGSSKNEQ